MKGKTNIDQGDFIYLFNQSRVIATASTIIIIIIILLLLLYKRGDTKPSRLESTTEITQNKHVKVLHYFVDDIKLLK